MLDKIKTDLIASMKSGDKVKVKTLRMITSAIKQIEVDKRDTVIDNTIVISVLNKMVKQRLESIDAFTKANRKDLIAIEEDELAIIKAYLPEQLDTVEIKSLVVATLESNGITNKKDLGKAMSLLKNILNGKADMKIVADLVKQHLI